MNLLLDANLSWRMVKKPSKCYSGVYHVDTCGLSIPASDIEIWNWAKTSNALIVTNDEDYYYLLAQKGFPPKVILLRIGNQSTQYIVDVLICKKPDVEALYESNQYGLLEIF